MQVEMTKEWCMNMAKIEARAAELHEGCQMPMEQARELAASEASPDWYARGQDWALADALSGSLPSDWTSGDIARAFAAGAQACAAIEGARILELECRRVALEEQADLTAIELNRLAELADSEGTRAVNYLLRARKAEKVLRELVALEDMRLRLRQLHEMGRGTNYADYHRLLPLAWDAARLALGSNVRAEPPP